MMCLIGVILFAICIFADEPILGAASALLAIASAFVY